MTLPRQWRPLLAAVWLVATEASRAADPGAAYAVCLACHGAKAEGNPATGAPALAGQLGPYLERQLRNFQGGMRGADPTDTYAAQMRATSATLGSAAAIAAAAKYFAALPPARPARPAGGDLRNGSNYYHARCGACHGGRAEGNAALSAPRLASLDAAYLKRQYLNFQQGRRGAHPQDRYGKQMRLMSSSLPRQKDLDDVIAFIQAQGAAR